MPRRIEIVGAGKAGRTLARLWSSTGTFAVGAIVNRSLASAQAAAAFIGQGRAAASVAELAAIDVLLIACSDGAIAACATEIARQAKALPGAVVLHLSGSASSEALAPLRALGCAVGSVHPVRSFADPAKAAAEFAGTWCGLEGDAEALPSLRAAFEAIGGRIFSIDRERKAIYHAGSVFASNYVAAMLQAGVSCFQNAGIEPALALEVLTQIAAGTVGNVAQLGAVKALTGPVARGETAVVERQATELGAWNAEIAAAYRAAGLLATTMAEERGEAPAEALAWIRERLSQSR